MHVSWDLRSVWTIFGGKLNLGLKQLNVNPPYKRGGGLVGNDDVIAITSEMAIIHPSSGL